MAKRNGRMISSEVCQSDAFRFLPSSSKSLYLQMVLSADDDGFVDCVKGLIRADGDSEGDLAALTGAGFVFAFPSGVCLITHWRYMNVIPKDRYQPTIYVAEMSRVRVGNETGVYSLAGGESLLQAQGEPVTSSTEACYKQTESLLQAQANLVTSSQEPCYKLDGSVLQASTEPVTQENRIEENRIEVNGREGINTSLPTGRDVSYAPAREEAAVVLSEEERGQLVGKMGEAMTQAYIDHLAEYIVRTGKKYPNHCRLILQWYEKDKREGKLPVVDGAESFDTDEFFEAAVRRQYGDAADQTLQVYRQQNGEAQK